MNRIPKYNYDSDYTTNAGSYYESLSRFTKSLQLMYERLNDVESRIKDLLIQWGEDGTLDEYLKGGEFIKPIISFRINDEGDLLYKIEYEGDNNSEIKLGNIKGPKGDKGDKGDKGEKGEKGDKGNDGKDGLTPFFRLASNGDLFVKYE